MKRKNLRKFTLFLSTKICRFASNLFKLKRACIQTRDEDVLTFIDNTIFIVNCVIEGRVHKYIS